MSKIEAVAIIALSIASFANAIDCALLAIRIGKLQQQLQRLQRR